MQKIDNSFFNTIKLNNPGLLKPGDEEIIKDLDYTFKSYPNNYKKGNRYNSMWKQAAKLSNHGIAQEVAVEYLKDSYQGYDEEVIESQVESAYTTCAKNFGVDR